MNARFLKVSLAALLLLLGLGAAQAAFIDVTTPGDTIVGLHNTVAGGANALSTVGTGVGQYPAAESPPNAIDNDLVGGVPTLTKYLNFGAGDGANTGFYVTPSMGSTVVGGLRFRVANDSANRDPLTFTLEGTNGDPASASWTLIASGNTGLTTDPGRNAWQASGDQPTFANVTAFTSYRLLFPVIRGTGQNSMQIGEVELLAVPEPSMIALVLCGTLGVFGWRVVRRRTA